MRYTKSDLAEQVRFENFRTKNCTKKTLLQPDLKMVV